MWLLLLPPLLFPMVERKMSRDNIDKMLQRQEMLLPLVVVERNDSSSSNGPAHGVRC
jgi:hypothetical protein